MMIKKLDSNELSGCIPHGLFLYHCNKCNQTVVSTTILANPISCCGEEMNRIVPGTSDGSAEKHIPQFTIDETTITVNVGSVPHPMEKTHHIEWIAIVTDKSLQIKFIPHEKEPTAVFHIEADETLKSVYSFCNIHGLWKTVNI